MTLILKSDQLAKSRIASPVSRQAPTDAVTHVDFVAGKYEQNQEPVGISTILTTLRSTVSGYIDVNNEYQEAPQDTLRIHNDPFAGKGALAEGGATNLLPDPALPASQTVSVNLANDVYYIFQVWGSGSASFKVAGKFDVVVTEEDPFVFRNIGETTESSLVVEVSGELSHYQAYASRSFTPHVAKLDPYHNTDHIYLNIPDLRQFSIILTRRLLNAPPAVLVGNTSYPLIQAFFRDTGAIGVFDAFGPTVSRKQLDGGGLQSRVIMDDTVLDDSLEIVSITFDLDNEVVKLCQNPDTVSNTSYTGTFSTDPVDRILLGAASIGNWPGMFGQLIKEVYVYDRILSDDEMIRLY